MEITQKMTPVTKFNIKIFNYDISKMILDSLQKKYNCDVVSGCTNCINDKCREEILKEFAKLVKK